MNSFESSCLISDRMALTEVYKTELRAMMAPAVLPTIDLTPESIAGRITTYQVNSPEDSIPVGLVSVLVDGVNLVDNLSSIKLTMPHRMGYGSAIYATVIARSLALGHDFRNDPSGLELPSLNMWRRLVRVGIAEQVVATPEGAENSGLGPRFLGSFVVRSTLPQRWIGRS